MLDFCKKKMTFIKILHSNVVLGSQDILDDSSWGPQKRFFGFSFGGYVEGGADFNKT